MSLIVADTQKGKIQGVYKGEYTEFRGIPYAKPPVGELRWKPPAEIVPWDKVYKADRFSCKCPQLKSLIGTIYQIEFYNEAEYQVPMDEDCLYLNIWTSAKTPEEKLPVVMWIHGGAYVSGYGHEIEFGGEAYAKRNVILVSINYRLGAFGFLVHPWLMDENSDGRAGNYGILDQIAAINWIHENIEAFGGDPDNVTIMGQSAGAMSVQTLISSPLIKGLVHKAILQSGGGYKNGLICDTTIEEAAKVGDAFIKNVK